jgi:hypothetical protein
MIWLLATWAWADELQVGLAACDDGDVRGALEPLDQALVDPSRVKVKHRKDALLCRARGILALPDAGRDARIDQAASDLLGAQELGASGPYFEAARDEVADLLLASIVGAFQPGVAASERQAATPRLQASLALVDAPLARALSVRATLPDDLDAAAGHAKAALALPGMADEDLSVAMIALSPVPDLIVAERIAEARALLRGVEALAPKLRDASGQKAQADSMLASLRLQLALADPATPAAELKALAGAAPEAYGVLGALGARLLEAGEEEVALQVIARAEAVDPKRNEATFNLGAHYINAAAALTEAEPEAVDLVDRVKALMAKARTAMERAAAIDPADRKPLESLVQICTHLDDAECIRANKKALADL